MSVVIRILFFSLLASCLGLANAAANLKEIVESPVGVNVGSNVVADLKGFRIGSPEHDSASVYRGTAIVGVDALGRVVIGLDQTQRGASVPDGFVDQYFLFTAQERIEGPWAQLIPDARILHKPRRLLLRSGNGDVLFSLALEDASTNGETRRKHHRPQTLIRHDGRELVGLTAPDGTGVSLASLDHSDIATWPQPFWTDLLSSGTGGASTTKCSSEKCNAGGGGGTGARSCSINCGRVLGSCSVACMGECIDFACCDCGFSKSCRCKRCTGKCLRR